MTILLLPLAGLALTVTYGQLSLFHMQFTDSNAWPYIALQPMYIPARKRSNWGSRFSNPARHSILQVLTSSTLVLNGRRVLICQLAQIEPRATPRGSTLLIRVFLGPGLSLTKVKESFNLSSFIFLTR